MVKKLLWWCSGANIELLYKSTYNDKQRYLSIGVTVIISSILSTFSAFYAFNSITENEISSGVLGLMWGVLITSLNRLIFSSIRISDQSLSSRISSTIPRLIIAVVIAFTLSFPFQIKLFEASINNRIYIDRQNQLDRNTAELRFKIKNQENDIKLLRDKYLQEIAGNGISGNPGNGEIANTLRKRIELSEKKIFMLETDYNQYRQETSKVKIGLIERIETLNKLRNENSSINFTYIFFLLLFLLIELIPIILQLLTPKSLYDRLLEESEYLPKEKSTVENSRTTIDNKKNITANKSNFELYCNKVVLDLEFQIDKNRLKAAELLRTGIIIIISGILGYIGVAYLLVGVFFEMHEFKPHYFYLMVSLSLLFIFIQFLGGWFLRQYRRTLNSSLYLNTLKPNLDKYLLSYYVICEFSNEEERKNLLKELLLIVSNEFKNLDSSLLTLQEENFAKEVTDSINSLKDTIANFNSKLS